MQTKDKLLRFLLCSNYFYFFVCFEINYTSKTNIFFNFNNNLNFKLLYICTQFINQIKKFQIVFWIKYLIQLIYFGRKTI